MQQTVLLSSKVSWAFYFKCINLNFSFFTDAWTPLHFAAQMGNLEIYEFLNKDITEVNPKTKNGVTPLHLAAKNGHLEVYKLICQNTRDKNPIMSNDLTPLHLGTRNGHLEVVKFITGDAHNIKPMIRGIWDDVSLFKLALYRGRFQLARFIFENNIEDIQFELRTHELFEVSILSTVAICRSYLAFGIFLVNYAYNHPYYAYNHPFQLLKYFIFNKIGIMDLLEFIIGIPFKGLSELVLPVFAINQVLKFIINIILQQTLFNQVPDN